MLKKVLIAGLLCLLVVGLSAPPLAAAPINGDDKPDVDGHYNVKGSIKFYDWTCKTAFTLKTGTWTIEQEGDKVECELVLDVPDSIAREWFRDGELEDGHLELKAKQGYVGPFTRNSKEVITNQPRLSQMGEAGEYCAYPQEYYFTWVINTKVYVCPKTGNVRSIKGDIKGWGEFGNLWEGVSSPTLGQFEGNFIATPIPGDNID